MSLNLQNTILLKRLVEKAGGEANFDIEGVTIERLVLDSRSIQPGDLFVALSGDSVDGHSYVPEALERGAVAAVVERAADTNAKLIVVPDTRIALALMAREYFGCPDEKLVLVGITGTNGKTTTTYMVQMIAKALGLEFGVIGTLGYDIRGARNKLDFTTPDPVMLYGVLAGLVEAGLSGASLEVSSHGLAQRRSDGLEYNVIAFSNLTQDHLDYHGDMERYFDTKSILFENVKPAVPSVINADDAYGQRLIGRTASEKILTYSIDNSADLVAKDVVCDANSIEFRLVSPIGEGNVYIPVPGKFNVFNALCASGIAVALGWDFSTIVEGLAQFHGVSGRFQTVLGNQPFSIYVDYSHTPDSLGQAIHACREIATGRVIVVFGCGGDRDRDKRPKMGAIAGELADVVVLTSDNPRSEIPATIIDQIESGVPTGVAKFRIDDRREAIEYALGIACSGDVILIAGKGHEDYQIIGAEKRHFDDREVAAEWLVQKGYREKF